MNSLPPMAGNPPPPTPSRNVRALALRVLQAVEREEVFADEALDGALREAARETPLDARDRALAWELVYGVLRHRGTLDWRLDHVADRPIRRLPPGVATALRMAAYQLLYLDRIPASAAVNESVNLVKLVKGLGSKPGRDWAGFVNAVLRNLLRKPAPPWPDPAANLVTALSVRYACPAWLVERWLARFGAGPVEALCRATLDIPPLTLRANLLRTTREALAADLAHAGYQARPTSYSPVGLILEAGGPVTEVAGFAEGAFYVEDEAAQLVPPLLDPQPGERVLDACAAPGGKATHLAALMQNRGEIIALDRSPPRLRLVEENCRRLGVRIVTALVADSTNLLPGRPGGAGRLLDRPFDRILVDAPCSGLGVLRRHPEGKWQKSAALLPRHRSRQLAILDQVSPLLRPGGVLVYSTCSTEPEENEQVIEHFCTRHAEFQREAVAPWSPPNARTFLTAQGDLSTMPVLLLDPQPDRREPMDVFFAARLRKVTRP